MSNGLYHSLLACVRLHLLQSYSLTDTLTCSKETFEFFKKTHRQAPPRKKIETPQYQAPVYTQPKPVAPTPKEVVTQKEVKPKESEHKKPQLQNAPQPCNLAASPQLLALCKKPLQAEPVVLSDVEKNIRNVKKERIPELQNAYPWQNTYPECLVISFFAKESTEDSFLCKMTRAITDRRGMRSALFQASSEAQAFMHTFATTGILRAIFIAYSNEAQNKVQEWLSELPYLEQNKDTATLLQCRHKLFGLPIFELIFSGEPTQQEKARLWKTLLQI